MKHLIGKRVRMIFMEDVDPIEPGQIGVVKSVDDLGQLQVDWDNGRTLAIIPEKDQFEVLDSYEKAEKVLTENFSLN
jgi:hypothetical protein